MKIKEFEERYFSDLVSDVERWIKKNEDVEVKHFSHAVVTRSHSNHYTAILMYEVKEEKIKNKKENNLYYKKVYGGYHENKTF